MHCSQRGLAGSASKKSASGERDWGIRFASPRAGGAEASARHSTALIHSLIRRTRAVDARRCMTVVKRPCRRPSRSRAFHCEGVGADSVVSRETGRDDILREWVQEEEKEGSRDSTFYFEIHRARYLWRRICAEGKRGGSRAEGREHEEDSVKKRRSALAAEKQQPLDRSREQSPEEPRAEARAARRTLRAGCRRHRHPSHSGGSARALASAARARGRPTSGGASCRRAPAS